MFKKRFEYKKDEEEKGWDTKRIPKTALVPRQGVFYLLCSLVSEERVSLCDASIIDIPSIPIMSGPPARLLPVDKTNLRIDTLFTLKLC